MNKNALTNILETFEKAKAELQKITKPMIFEHFKAIFDKYPYLVSFSFYGWVDYFNDGDSCTFNLHFYRVPIQIMVGNDSNIYDVDVEEDGYISDSTTLPPDNIFPKKNLETLNDDIAKLGYQIPNEVYQELFGDHFQLIINRSGKIKANPYHSHD